MSGEPPNNQDDLSQADIDAMMSGGSGAEAALPTPSRPAESAAADSAPAETGALGQADIDAMVNGGGGDAEAAVEAPSDPVAPPAATRTAGETGELSQADIDAALASAGASASPAAAADTEAAPAAAVAADSDFGKSGFSQADIDAVLGAIGSPGSASAPSALSRVNADGSPKLDSTGKPFDEAAAMMEAAIAEERAAAAAARPVAAATSPVPVEPPPPPAGSIPLELPSFSALGGDSDESSLDLLHDVDLDVKIELGRAQMLIEDVLRLGEGSVVELDKLAGDPVDVLVNERLVARGEVLILNDSFCVRISEIVAGIGVEEEAV